MLTQDQYLSHFKKIINHPISDMVFDKRVFKDTITAKDSITPFEIIHFLSSASSEMAYFTNKTAFEKNKPPKKLIFSGTGFNYALTNELAVCKAAKVIYNQHLKEEMVIEDAPPAIDEFLKYYNEYNPFNYLFFIQVQINKPGYSDIPILNNKSTIDTKLWVFESNPDIINTILDNVDLIRQNYQERS